MSQDNTPRKRITDRMSPLGQLSVLVVVLISGLTLALFQNCAKDNVAFNNDGELYSVAGATDGNDNDVDDEPVTENEDPAVDPPICVQGKKLGVWLDPDSDGNVNDQDHLGSFVAYSGAESMVDNYDYYSASAHPVHGPTPLGFNLNVYFYEGSDGLGMNFFSNIDEGGSDDNIVNLDLVTSGNDKKDSVLLSDDRGEMYLDSEKSDRLEYEGRFHYWKNTDGAVIGPFAGEGYKVQVKMLQSGDITGARFYSANGESFSLTNSDGVSSFVIAFESYETCQ